VCAFDRERVFFNFKDFPPKRLKSNKGRKRRENTDKLIKCHRSLCYVVLGLFSCSTKVGGECGSYSVHDCTGQTTGGLRREGPRLGEPGSVDEVVHVTDRTES